MYLIPARSECETILVLSFNTADAALDRDALFEHLPLWTAGADTRANQPATSYTDW